MDPMATHQVYKTLALLQMHMDITQLTELVVVVVVVHLIISTQMAVLVVAV
jgi:hypothetical protein